jgi:hypothetical protein
MEWGWEEAFVEWAMAQEFKNNLGGDKMKGLKMLLTGLAVLTFLGTSEVMAKRGGPYLPPADPVKVKEYCTEIQPLYQKEFQLRNEIRSMIWSGNPNWSEVESKEIEAAKLRVEMMKKAQEKGLPLRGVMGNIRRYCGW